jgi:hypothetical protein
MRSMRTPIPPIARSELTKAMLDYLGPLLATYDIMLGRGIAPQAGGWQGSGQPGDTTFHPYVVIKTMQAVSPAPAERDPLAANRTSWQLSYTMATHHRLESLVDDTAELPRKLICGFSRGEVIQLDGVAWTLQQITVPRLGATARDNSTDPPHWQVNDDVSLHVSKVERG